MDTNNWHTHTTSDENWDVINVICNKNHVVIRHVDVRFVWYQGRKFTQIINHQYGINTTWLDRPFVGTPIYQRYYKG